MDQLPEKYFKWLEQLGDEPLVEFADREWYLGTEEELNESTSVDDYVTPRWSVLKSYADSFDKISGTEFTMDDSGKPISLDFLRQSVAIGSDNGDVIFVSNEAPYSIWCYFPAGGDVKKLSYTLDSFISNSVNIS